MPSPAPQSFRRISSSTWLGGLCTFVLSISLLGACSANRGAPEATSDDAAGAAKAPQQIPEETAYAYFAGGCFWGVEYYMEKLDGVIEVESGYMGGEVENPTYEQVASQTSGHYETVRVHYDPARVDYAALAKRFYEIHDPTQADGQGPDIGPEYLSVGFYASPEEKSAHEGLHAQLEKRGYKVATKLLPAGRFWRAEEYHQDHYVRKGSKPYCHAFVPRFDEDAS